MDMTSEALADMVKTLGAEALAYLERKRVDRREVFEKAYADADEGAKVDLALAFLDSPPVDAAMAEVISQGVTKAAAQAVAPVGTTGPADTSGAS